AFGLLLSQSDLNGSSYSYTYDSARQLTKKSSSRSPNGDVIYKYDAAGNLTEIHDYAEDQITQYAYDLAGNHISESVTQHGILSQSNILAYDTNNRLRNVQATSSQGTMTINIEYDLVGNRTHISTQQDLQPKVDRWFDYDAMNRQT